MITSSDSFYTYDLGTYFTILPSVPKFNLNNSTKFASSVAPIAFLVKVKSILNLWAPGAFVFETPCALSFKVLSSVGVTKDSVTNRPTLY